MDKGNVLAIEFKVENNNNKRRIEIGPESAILEYGN